jgi:outer membrane immunogenic protein
MRKVAIAVAIGAALIGPPAFAADMATKTPPSAPTPIPSWTGFYFGGEFGAGWSDRAVNFTGNDPVAAFLISGTAVSGPAPNDFRLSQSGAIGGFEAGYNWQAGVTWLLGLETDFSLAGLSGSASATSLLFSAPLTLQSSAVEQKTEWYGTVRGRIGWLPTPNLLLFGTGGFAYGRVVDSANYMLSHTVSFATQGGHSAICVGGLQCFLGASSGS